jgi:RHS repeat-associated protein
VLATISDKKIGHDSSGVVNYYTAEVLSQNDYYPFGMMISGRKFSLGDYRYGFNRKENDNEVKGEGNQQDYGMRIYDPRLGKFLSTDPITSDFPNLTPYQFASNSPNWAIDLDGMEAWVVVKKTVQDKTTISLKFDKDLLNPGGVYFVHRYFTDPNNRDFQTSEVSGSQKYSEYPNIFPQFSKGKYSTFSSEITEAVTIEGEANLLFAEVGLEGKFAGAGLGGSFGGNGKIIGLNINSKDDRGIKGLGWQSTFRGKDQSLNVGGAISYIAGVEYRHKFDLEKGFVDDSKFGYNGVFTSGEVNPYKGESKLSWGISGKAALGFGFNFELRMNVDVKKLSESLRSVGINYSNYEKKQLEFKEKGSKEFNPQNYQ